MTSTPINVKPVPEDADDDGADQRPDDRASSAEQAQLPSTTAVMASRFSVLCPASGSPGSVQDTSSEQAIPYVSPATV